MALNMDLFIQISVEPSAQILISECITTLIFNAPLINIGHPVNDKS